MIEVIVGGLIPPLHGMELGGLRLRTGRLEVLEKMKPLIETLEMREIVIHESLMNVSRTDPI